MITRNNLLVVGNDMMVGRNDLLVGENDMLLAIAQETFLERTLFIHEIPWTLIVGLVRSGEFLHIPN